MITGELKNRIDRLWEAFWTGGVANPLTVIEQITFLMFARLLDITEARNEARAKRTGKTFRRVFSDDEQDLRWRHFTRLGGDQMLPLLRDRVFPHFKTVALEGTTFGEYMKDAQLMVQKPSLLVQAVKMIEDLPLTEGDTKGDLYEYLLSKLTTAGINGQFRTPRHIIRFMVDLLEPKPTDTIADPACGTAGFLVSVMQYLLEHCSSEEGTFEETGDDGRTYKVYTGDLLEEHWPHIRKGMFHGFDFDATMLRIAAMNLLLHGVEQPDIHYQDTLSGKFSERFPKSAADGFDIVLANPPFKGNLDYEDVDPGILRQVRTKKTELLFVALILRMLKLGGRSATIVPNGVLFGSSKAHKALRALLVDQNQLEAVISLPSGVFRPYAGVSTAIIVFTKGGRTDNVFFYDVKADGFSPDDKRNEITENDLPDALNRWKTRDPDKDTERTGKAFLVGADEIRGNKFDLSINRYKESLYEQECYEPPREILSRIRSLEVEIEAELASLEEMLS